MISFIADLSRKFFSAIPNLPRGFALVWRASRRWTIIWGSLLAAQAALPVVSIYLSKLAIDALVVAINEKGEGGSLRSLILRGGALVLTIGMTEALRSFSNLARAAQAEYLNDYVTSLIHDQSVKARYSFYEDPVYYDHLYRARENAGYRMIGLVESLGGFLQSLISVIGIMLLLVSYWRWLPIALLLGLAPALFVVLRYISKEHEWRRLRTSEERRALYYDWVLTSGEAAAEVRVFNLGGYFQELYRGLRGGLRAEQLKLARNQSLAELSASVFALLVFGATFARVVWDAVTGAATLGSLAMFYQSFSQGRALANSLLSNAGELYANSLFLENLFQFLAVETEPENLGSTPPRCKDYGIEFESVTFKYPGSEREALNDFSVCFPAGKISAVVGSNGAGKSTLIKLLCGLYAPGSGRITIGEVDINGIERTELRKLITVIFQTPVHYNGTVAENIKLGDVLNDSDRARIDEAARAAGADGLIAGLPDGYETSLGKWFANGQELSAGEWQRIALTRAFWRNSPIILLDEPTSAMDSWSETEWIDKLRNIAGNRTTILITHRFTTAMRADVIYVMESGRIQESGTHLQLMEMNGRYAQSWQANTAPPS